jgi:3-hydroxyacyl-[acyl-carrier-protein] dehydratase
MHFALIDTVLECSPTRVVAVKQVTLAEEYLQDHFPTFHVLPGVFMLEALVQAARHLLDVRGGAGVAGAAVSAGAGAPRAGVAGTGERWVLGQVRALRYGSFVRPGECLRVEVTLDKEQPDGSVVFKGAGTVQRQGADPAQEPETAVSGRFTMRHLRVPSQVPQQVPVGA